MNSSLEQKRLLYRLQIEHDPEAYATLYDLFVKQIYRFVYFKVASREEAEDITSEVFLKAWHYLQENKEVKSFSGLLYKIARNAIIDLYRSKSARPEALIIDAEFDLASEPDLALGVESKIEHARILGALKKLKQEYQEVLTLRYVDDLGINEIAEIISKNEISVRVTIHRALKRLKEILQP
ncbi:MAG: RNA polymerase sigma factor [Candidatus Magasanikbacteria bacterium]|nr:RNA polymerase sigma factor [Candidatus Magasanikbacteria bacterium]